MLQYTVYLVHLELQNTTAYSPRLEILAHSLISGVGRACDKCFNVATSDAKTTTTTSLNEGSTQDVFESWLFVDINGGVESLFNYTVDLLIKNCSSMD